MNEATLSVNVGAGQLIQPLALMKNKGQRLIPMAWYLDVMDSFHDEKKKRLERVFKVK